MSSLWSGIEIEVEKDDLNPMGIQFVHQDHLIRIITCGEGGWGTRRKADRLLRQQQCPASVPSRGV